MGEKLALLLVLSDAGCELAGSLLEPGRMGNEVWALRTSMWHARPCCERAQHGWRLKPHAHGWDFKH